MELEHKNQSQAPIDLKVILLGDVSVGKTSFVNRYISGTYTEKPNTLGASFLLKVWGAHKIAIWDTSGEERFRGLSRYYCRGAGAVVMAFDLTDEKSFYSLRKEFVPLLGDTLDGRQCAVVGMKSDLVTSDSKSKSTFREEGTKLAEELNDGLNKMSMYFETSSLTGDCVEKVFESLFESCLPTMTKKNDLESSVALNKANESRQSCSC